MIKKFDVLPIRIVKFNVSSVGPSLERNSFSLTKEENSFSPTKGQRSKRWTDVKVSLYKFSIT